MFLFLFIFDDKFVVSLNEGKNSFVIIFVVWDVSGMIKFDLVSNVILKLIVVFIFLILLLFNYF